MSHANHAIVLAYAHDKGTTPIGTVSCVPRVGDVVFLQTEGPEPTRYYVAAVAWEVRDNRAADPTHGTHYTVATCALERSQTGHDR